MSGDAETGTKPAPVAAGGATVGVPWWVVSILTLALGLAGGVAIGTQLDDGDGSNESGSLSVDCERARSVVQRAVDEMTSIGEDAPEQDATFFAAMIVEQRSVTFTMDLAPDCFSLEDRAAATGLLAGLEGLLATASPASQPIFDVAVPEDPGPSDNSSDEGE